MAVFLFIQVVKQSVFTPIFMNKTNAVEVIALKELFLVYMLKKADIGSFCMRRECIFWERLIVS